MAAKFKVLTHGDGLLRSSVTYARVCVTARGLSLNSRPGAVIARLPLSLG
jgi:hypothetical protein